mgnify:CR=1 FL=1
MRSHRLWEWVVVGLLGGALLAAGFVGVVFQGQAFAALGLTRDGAPTSLPAGLLEPPRESEPPEDDDPEPPPSATGLVAGAVAAEGPKPDPATLDRKLRALDRKKLKGLDDGPVTVAYEVVDPETGKFNVALIQDVVADEDWYDEHSEIGITEAQKIRKSYEVGDRVVTPLKTKDFGRIAAQTAKHVIRQGIREAERSQQLSEIQSRAHDIIQATVTRVDNEKGIVALDLGKGGEAILPRNEQVPGEVYTEGQTLQVYVVDVVSTERGPRVMISRTHPGLVKRLFELEVPEIYDGTVEVKAISREAGARTKMAVWSKDANVNPVSACIGPHGDRVAAVVEKLGGEKIDIVKWSEDVSEFISAALSPAKVLKVELLPGETRSCRVTVPDQQLSLAIGNKGQNARLCARLTGYNIDIRPESGYYGEDEEPKAAEPKTEDAE